MDIRGEVDDMVVAVGTVMCRDVQGVVSLLMKPLMLYLKMISRIDQFVPYKLLLFFPFKKGMLLSSFVHVHVCVCSID